MDCLKLKSPQVVRLFISSPFNGMEQERDILTKFHWPKIQSALSAKGLHLKLVDMRWGITDTSSNDSQTINICLKEVDRCDIFIGLFGQRYGWNGRNDQSLQDNFDKAAEKYPWVDHYRDRSITELEFFHGHLNKPGQIPACFCFRDGIFDEQMRKEAEFSGDTKKLRSYSSESENSLQLLNDLKNRVELTRLNTLGIYQDYKTPKEGADFIFETLWNYIQKEILDKIEKPITEVDEVTFAHKSHLASQSHVYVGGQEYFDQLENYIKSEENSPVVVTAPAGYGKTVLLSNWINRKLSNEDLAKTLIYYHFVGAESDGTLARYIMTRLIRFIKDVLNDEDYPYKNTQGGRLSNLKREVDDLKKALLIMNTDENKDKKLVIVIDSIDKVQRKKASRPLFWLPNNLPNNVYIIVSLTKDTPESDEVLEVLLEEHKATQLHIKELSPENKKELITCLLEENSKSMEHEQLQLIFESSKTNHPLFLKILINELCVAGRFRELTQQISNLLASDNIVGLITSVLNRIWKDYKFPEYSGDAVEEILCALYLCKKGVLESDFPMPQHVWTPVHYVIEAYLVDRGGQFGFAFIEMSEAVKSVFMPTAEREEQMARKIADNLYNHYMSCNNGNKPIPGRTGTELLNLLKLSNDRSRLLEVLSDIKIFQSVTRTDYFQLNSYWQWLGIPAQAMCNRYLRSLDCYIARLYNDHLEHSEMDVWENVLERKSMILQDLRMWFEDLKLFHGLEKLFNVQLELDQHRPGLSDLQRKNQKCSVKYRMAHFLSNTERYKESLQLHMEVLEERKELIEAKVMDPEDIGMSYHGIGLCQYHLKEFNEAETWYSKSLKAQTKPGLEAMQSSTFCNLGLICIGKMQLKEALTNFHKSNELRNIAEPSKLSLEIAYNYHNIGLTYRKMKDLNTAEEYYLKSLKIKEKLLGRMSFDVALSIMNLGTLNVHKKNHEAALGYAEEALRIFKCLAPNGSHRTMMAQENMVNQLTLLNRYEEAVEPYKEVCEYLKTTKDGFANGLSVLHRRFFKWFIEHDRYEEAAEVAYHQAKCSKAKPIDFAHLGHVNEELPIEKKLKLPENLTLEYALGRWPTDSNLLSVKLSILCTHEVSHLLTFVRDYCEVANERDAIARYLSVSETLVEDQEAEKAIMVLEAGIAVRPTRIELSEALRELNDNVNKA